jgi:hypothetical protein
MDGADQRRLSATIRLINVNPRAPLFQRIGFHVQKNERLRLVRDARACGETNLPSTGNQLTIGEPLPLRQAVEPHQKRKKSI